MQLKQLVVVLAIPTSFWLQTYVKLADEPTLVVDVGNFATLEQAKEKALQVGQDGFCVEGTVIEQEVELVCYPPSVIDHSVIIKTQ